MIQQTNHADQHEKVLTFLHHQYVKGINFLKLQHFEQGISCLLQILKHPYIHDADLDNLKYSIFMSLAEVQEVQKDLYYALGFYWQALQILEKKSETIKGQLSSKDHSEKPQQFNLLLKMVLIGQTLSLSEQLVYLLKKAIKLSPLIWRQKLLLKLKGVYEKDNKLDYLKDLDILLDNNEKLDSILAQKHQLSKNNSMSNKMLKQLEHAEGHNSTIQKITIYLNLQQKDQIFLKYSCWQTLLTITYVLLKCQNKRNFNNNKNFHRKFDDSNKDWCRLIQQFDIHSTKIQIIFSEKVNELINNESPHQQPDWGKIVSDIAQQILKQKYSKKKTKKLLNPLQQLTRLPSTNSKDPKKINIAQTKSIFTSLQEYYKQQFAKNHYKKQNLNNLKFLGEQKFNSILGDLMNQQVLKDKEENEDDDIEASYSAIEGHSSGDKDVVKQKKTMKVKKMELIMFQKKVSSLIPLILKTSENNKVSFINILEMIEQITEQLLDQNLYPDQKAIILNNSAIRRIFQKNIVKILQKGDGYFQNINSNKFLEILLEKLQQIVDKEAKTKNFKNHQQFKKKCLITFIKDNFLPSTYLIQEKLVADLSLMDIKRQAFISFSFLKMNSFYEMINQSQISYYRELYIIFKIKEQKKCGSLLSEQQLNRKNRNFIDRQIQKYQKKVVARSSLMNIKDEKEQSSSVDDIYKKDTQILAILPLLKIFNCHPEQIKNKSIENNQQLSGQQYLQTFVKICQLFFMKIQLQSTKQFNCRILTLLSDIINLRLVIQELYNKFTDSKTFKDASLLDRQILYQTLLFLVKIFLLNLPEDNDNSIKITFIIFNYIIKNQEEELKYLIIPKCICMFDDMIKFKKNKIQSLSSVKKRFYQQLIVKNIQYIYNSPLFQIKNQQKEIKKNKKMIKKYSESQIIPRQQEQGIVVKENQIEDIREKVFDILHDIYFCSDKDKDFNPKKIEEAVGYFMYLLRAYYEMFEEKVIELQNQALKVFKKCFKLFMEKRDDIFKLCWKFKVFGQTFNSVMNGADTLIQKQEFIAIVKGEKVICQCCGNLRQTHNLYVQSMFVIGKFFETQFEQPQLAHSKQQWLQDIDKDENFYLDYLLMNLDKQQAWYNLIRVNCTKSFYYFDSILNKPFQQFKNKFYLTKKVIHFVNDVFPMFTQINTISLANLQLLNLLKIKQRQYMMIQKQIQLDQSVSKESKESKDLAKKYNQGMKRVYAGMIKQPTKDVRVRYIRWSQIKLKLVWNNMIKENHDEKLQNLSVVIELDEDSNNSKIFHKPSKNISQLQQVVEQAKEIIQCISTYSGGEHVSHLTQDIVMELYILLSRTIQWKIEKMVIALCDSMKCSTAFQQSKKIRQAQFFMSDTYFLIRMFGNGQFLTTNPRYKLLQTNLTPTQEEIHNIQNIFIHIFANNANNIQMDAFKQEKIVNEQKSVIIINEDVQVPEQPKSRISQHSIDSKSQRSRSGSEQKKRKVSKTLVLELGTYIYQKIIQFVYENDLFKNPLNNLQRTLCSSFFLQLIAKCNKILNEVVRIILQLPKYQFKKQKYRRSVVLSMLYCSHLAMNIANLPNKANDIIKDYYSFKNDEFTLINTYCDRLTAQKNEFLMDFYNRIIVHHIMKIHFIKQIFHIFMVMGNKDGLTTLCRKLMKINKASESKIQKDKGTKNQQKEQMEDQGKKDGAIKQANLKQLEVTTTFNLFCLGTWKFVEILIKECEQRQIQQRYERALKQFKNKIKKKIGDEKSIYLQKIEQFLTYYQAKYQKKIKLKKTKKDRQLESQKNAEIVAAIKQDILSVKPTFLEKTQPNQLLTFMDLTFNEVQLKNGVIEEKDKNRFKAEVNKTLQLSSKRSKSIKQKKQLISTAVNQAPIEIIDQNKSLIPVQDKQPSFTQLYNQMKQKLLQVQLPISKNDQTKQKVIIKDDFVDPFIIIEYARNRHNQSKQSPSQNSKRKKLKEKKVQKKQKKQLKRRQKDRQFQKKQFNQQKNEKQLPIKQSENILSDEEDIKQVKAGRKKKSHLPNKIQRAPRKRAQEKNEQLFKRRRSQRN